MTPRLPPGSALLGHGSPAVVSAPAPMSLSSPPCGPDAGTRLLGRPGVRRAPRTAGRLRPSTAAPPRRRGGCTSTHARWGRRARRRGGDRRGAAARAPAVRGAPRRAGGRRRGLSAQPARGHPAASCARPGPGLRHHDGDRLPGCRHHVGSAAEDVRARRSLAATAVAAHRHGGARRGRCRRGGRRPCAWPGTPTGRGRAPHAGAGRHRRLRRRARHRGRRIGGAGRRGPTPSGRAFRRPSGRRIRRWSPPASWSSAPPSALPPGSPGCWSTSPSRRRRVHRWSTRASRTAHPARRGRPLRGRGRADRHRARRRDARQRRRIATWVSRGERPGSLAVAGGHTLIAAAALPRRGLGLRLLLLARRGAGEAARRPRTPPCRRVAGSAAVRTRRTTSATSAAKDAVSSRRRTPPRSSSACSPRRPPTRCACSCRSTAITGDLDRRRSPGGRRGRAARRLRQERPSCWPRRPGDGYVSYVQTETVEMLTRGDCTTVAVPYANVPSAVAFPRRARAAAAYAAYARALAARARELNPQARLFVVRRVARVDRGARRVRPRPGRRARRGRIQRRAVLRRAHLQPHRPRAAPARPARAREPWAAVRHRPRAGDRGDRRPPQPLAPHRPRGDRRPQRPRAPRGRLLGTPVRRARAARVVPGRTCST